MSSSPPASPKGEKRKNSAREEDLVVELDDLVELDDEPMETSRPASTPTHTEFPAADLRQKKLETPDYVPERRKTWNEKMEEKKAREERKAGNEKKFVKERLGPRPSTVSSSSSLRTPPRSTPPSKSPPMKTPETSLPSGSSSSTATRGGEERRSRLGTRFSPADPPATGPAPLSSERFTPFFSFFQLCEIYNIHG